MKFGMGILLNMGMVHGWVATKFPDPWGEGVWPASAGSTIDI
jgi:hypothetical protein